MTIQYDGHAVVYCEGAFNTPNGKTAHGLVRFTRRYQVLCVIDRTYAGQDAGMVLDERRREIPVVANLQAALDYGVSVQRPASHFVVGLAPDGGRLDAAHRDTVMAAMKAGLQIDSGLHDFISEDAEFSASAAEHGVRIRDVRKPPSRKDLHFFSGKIEEVDSLTIAVLGTDSAVGKRTTAWLLVQAFEKAGKKAELIGTGQTAWMQGAQYGVIMDSLINDFVAGEIEHAVWSAWDERRPDVIVIEGQGSLMNPAYPGGFEILAAGRPDVIVLQHAPAREEYDGFPGYKLHPLPQQIQVLEMLSEKQVVAVTLNHENLEKQEIPAICRTMSQTLGLPVFDVLLDGADDLAESLLPLIRH